ncbi:hypothetical protein O6H91_01G104400 [Diphasiastrum complanatum]|uniref:Uncharacterized protein n=1 Tax=Diphasiastrum complanatum TaxID=34168 RepID=A0ACC2EUD1_DIPCM|nr:hypothetical protein O6H91_01G104400 [Diphasiastrum complanatum]
MDHMNNCELAAVVRASMALHSSPLNQFSFTQNRGGFAFSPPTSMLHNRCSSEFGSAMAAVKAAGCFGTKELQDLYNTKTIQLYSNSATESGIDPMQSLYCKDSNSSLYCKDSNSSLSQYCWSQTNVKQERPEDDSSNFSQGTSASAIALFSRFSGANGNSSHNIQVEKHDQYSLPIENPGSAPGANPDFEEVLGNSPQILMHPLEIQSSERVPSDISSQSGNQSKDQQSNPTSEELLSTDQQTPKRRKVQPQKQVVYVPLSSGTNRPNGGGGVSSDVWAWRKYGQKPIKGSPYPRGYYRCSSSKGCSARKQVEKSRTDPSMLIVTYTSEHNHPFSTATTNPTPPSTDNVSSKTEEKANAHELQDDSFFRIVVPDASLEEIKPIKSIQKFNCDEQANILAQGSDTELKKLSSRLTTHDGDFFATLEELTESSSLFKAVLVHENADDEVSGGVVIDPYDIFNTWSGDAFAERDTIAQF